MLYSTTTSHTKVNYYCAPVSVTCRRSVVFSIIKTDRHNITEILLKVTLNTITHPLFFQRGSRGHDRMVVRFTTTYAISAYHH